MADPGPVRLTPAGGGSAPPLAVAALIVLAIAAALLKPWGPGQQAAAQVIAPSRLASPSTVPIAAPGGVLGTFASPEPGATIGGPCYWGMAWRLFTTETSDVGPIHTWYGLEPQAASGPTDPAIQVTRIHSSAIGQLGYCTISRPGTTHVLATQAWVLVPGGAPRLLALAPAVGTAPANPDDGVIYRAPALTAWPAATYVFGIHLATTPRTEEWFAVQIL